jgi:type I restriction enzyme R subunit
MSERSEVQNPMLKYAAEIGWQYVSPADALARRGGDRGLFFTDDLAAQLMRLNPGVLDSERAVEVIRRLNLLRPTIEGNRDALSWLRGEQSIFVPEENRERNVRLIDFDNPDKNLFHVTDEWIQRGAVYRNRADVGFLINGIPVAVAETKKAAKPDGLEEGVQQLRRYHKETPELFTSTQVFEVTQLVDFFYGVTWNTVRKNLFNWKDEEAGDYERKIKGFFDRLRFLRLLREHLVFLNRDDVLVKIILRQHQTRAVEKGVERARDPVKRRGLVWHTQGSGKTLTMISIASRLLRETQGGDKPTVLMIVDRLELEGQLLQNLAHYGIANPREAHSKRELQNILSSDYRGLVVSMIHKFDDVPANLNTRENIIILVDEAHRTTGGNLGNYLMGALPNATYLGFTGTPIDRTAQGKGTFKVFGVDDAQGYLDKYSIAESIEDGTTVRLHYALAPSHLLVDRETLEKQFMDLAQTQGISDLEELNAILDRAVELKELMKTPTRIEAIARSIAEHYRNAVEPMGFKAFVVAVDREACVLYKQALDKYLPPDYSRVVYSPSHNDEEQLKRHYLESDEEKRLRKAFVRKDSLPKILIVTEKLLTGFDAPILYCMYLDKPMRDHVLLQAIARVNRPYEDEDGLVKPCGFVLDFVGIFEKLEQALAFDSDIVASVIQNVDVLKKLFETWMREAAPDYLPLARGFDDKAKERAIDHFADRAKREEFFKFFKQLQGLYDILSPDAFLRPFLEDYLALSELFALIRNAYADRVYVDREVTTKTRELLRQHTDGQYLQLPGAVHELGAAELAALKQGDTSDIAKILNLRKLLTATVQRDGAAKPFLTSIGERAEQLAQAYEDRQLTTQQVLLEFQNLAQRYVESDEERQRLGIDENSFAIYTTVKLVASSVTTEQATALNGVFGRYPDYQWDQQQKGQLRAELYKALRPVVGPAKLIEVANTLLRLQRV